MFRQPAFDILRGELLGLFAVGPAMPEPLSHSYSMPNNMVSKCVE